MRYVCYDSVTGVISKSGQAATAELAALQCFEGHTVSILDPAADLGEMVDDTVLKVEVGTPGFAAVDPGYTGVVPATPMEVVS